MWDRIYVGGLAGGAGIAIAIGLTKMARDLGRSRNDRYKAPWERH
jgi:uncharacterized membrane protein YedE/YeeE